MIPAMAQFEQLVVQSTEQILLSGADARLTLNSTTSVNKYGCGSVPDNALIAFGSSTGSTISERGFGAAHALHLRLRNQETALTNCEVYRHELERIRCDLNHYCGFSDHTDIASIFAASGTDLHLICAQLFASNAPDQKPLHIIMMDACETGSGVAPAVRGQHFSDHAALGGNVKAFEPLPGAYPVTVSSIGLRLTDGARRPLDAIDAEVNTLIQDSIAIGQRVLLIMIDVSKTGLIAPSPQTIFALRRDFPDQVDVLVDACQFRMSSATLNAYLKIGCMVALTGSKFLTGPVFSGVLQIPGNLIARLSQKTLPRSVASYSAQTEWPVNWRAAEHLSDHVNWGLLLRLEAALAELKAFRALPEQLVSAFLQQFSVAIQQALLASPHFECLALSQLDRSPVCNTSSWDQIPTILPFLLLHQPGHPLSREQVQQVYKQLQFPQLGANAEPTIAALRCQLGQPVLCGTQYGTEVSALRMCASSRVILEACSHGAESGDRVIQRALQTLRKAENLIQNLC